MTGWIRNATVLLTSLGFFLAPVLSRSAERAESVVAEFPVATGGDCLCVPVSVGGHTHTFLLDTGCDTMVYDTTLGDHLGDPVGTAKLNGGRLIQTFKSPRARLGPVDLQTDEPVCCIDLTRVREATGYDVKGIIGMSALRAIALRVDFDKGRLSVLRHVNPESGEDMRLYYRSPSKPTVLAVLPTVGLTQLCIDTGSSGSLTVTEELFAQLDTSNHIRHKGQGFSLGVELAETRHDGLLEFVEVGSFSLCGVGMHSSRQSSVGLGLLSRFVVTFDFPNRTMYLRPGVGFERPEWRNQSGLTIIRRDGKTVIFNVEKGSTSEDKGIERGDVVVSINGFNASEYSIFKIKQLIGVRGTEIDFVLQRESRSIKRSITLSEE